MGVAEIASGPRGCSLNVGQKIYSGQWTVGVLSFALQPRGPLTFGTTPI